ncbi:hypothetical protein B0H10DRAFT_18622 [Mycena sp. CBHHK59/15]|nr:hypothetical protein B0H10DRAFT_18622 [Mycena sp. CBHHK59/15]
MGMLKRFSQRRRKAPRKPGGSDVECSFSAAVTLPKTTPSLASAASSSMIQSLSTRSPPQSTGRIETSVLAARALVAVCDAPVLNTVKPIAGLALLICETVKTAKNNDEAVVDLVNYAVNIAELVVQRAKSYGLDSELGENIQLLEDALHQIYQFLDGRFRKRRFAKLRSLISAPREQESIRDLECHLIKTLHLLNTSTSLLTCQRVSQCNKNASASDPEESITLRKLPSEVMKFFHRTDTLTRIVIFYYRAEGQRYSEIGTATPIS